MSQQQETGSPSAEQALVVGIVERRLHDPRRSALAEDLHRELRAGLKMCGRQIGQNDRLLDGMPIPVLFQNSNEESWACR